MTYPAFSSNLDILHGTLERIMTKEPVLSYAHETYADLNAFLNDSTMQVTGDELKGQLVTGTVGNAKWQSPHAADTLIAKNITKEFRLEPLRHLQGGMVFNKMVVSANTGPEKLFDVVKLQWRKARAEVVDAYHVAMWSCLTGADDVDSIASIPYWLRLGTQGSAGTYSGYQSRYNDGNTPGTVFDTAGLNCTAAINPEFANLYADHAGNLDESLFRVINKVMMMQNFQPSRVLETGKPPVVKYTCFTSQNVILTLNTLKMKLNSNVGPEIFGSGYYPLSTTTIPGSIPLIWSDRLDTANVSLYGTDPIYCVNLNVLYPVYLKDWKFALTGKDNPDNHLERLEYIDLAGQTWCEAPKYAGALISNHPSN